MNLLCLSTHGQILIASNNAADMLKDIYGQYFFEIYTVNWILTRDSIAIITSKIYSLDPCTFYHESGFISSVGYNGVNGKTSICMCFLMEIYIGKRAGEIRNCTKNGNYSPDSSFAIGELLPLHKIFC